jgi:hypothetical protein
MTIRIQNYSPELLGRLQGLVEVEGSDLLLVTRMFLLGLSLRRDGNIGLRT